MKNSAHHVFDPNLPVAATPTAWEAFTAPTYGHQRSVNAVGQWFLGHQRDPHEPIEIKYQMPLLPGETYESISAQTKGLAEKDFTAFHALFVKLSANEIGFIANATLGQAFVDHCRTFRTDRLPDALLEAAGFKFAHELPANENESGPTRVFSLPDGRRGTFSVMVSPDVLWMTHEKRNATHWSNLLRVGLGQASYDAEGWIQSFWSPEVQSPIGAAADFAKVIVQEWVPQPRQAPVRRRSP